MNRLFVYPLWAEIRIHEAEVNAGEENCYFLLIPETEIYLKQVVFFFEQISCYQQGDKKYVSN